jgi:hypothetical protein
MIVFCEDCGERNIVDLEEAKEKGIIRCRACNDILKFAIPKESAPPPPKPAPTQLEIRLGDHTIEIGQTRPTVTMGRQEHNDLEVIDTRVSRSHARIEFRKGKFFLVDHSTNGTFVMINGQKGINLKRNEVALEGSGIITLGRKVTPDSPKAIHFVLRP